MMSLDRVGWGSKRQKDRRTGRRTEGRKEGSRLIYLVCCDTVAVAETSSLSLSVVDTPSVAIYACLGVVQQGKHRYLNTPASIV
jgi:hypothetical protein